MFVLDSCDLSGHCRAIKPSQVTVLWSLLTFGRKTRCHYQRWPSQTPWPANEYIKCATVWVSNGDYRGSGTALAAAITCGEERLAVAT